jgi:hypothetical protein
MNEMQLIVHRFGFKSALEKQAFTGLRQKF